MSTAPNSVMQVTSYPESPAVDATLNHGDEQTSRKPERAASSFLGTIVGRRGSLRCILSQVEAVAATNTTVLITGETGAGKEVRPGSPLLAREHSRAPKLHHARRHPFQ